MKVILLQDITGIGKRGELKEIKDGYARNFLLPKKQAEFATPEALRRWKDAKAAQEKQTQDELKRLDKTKQILAELTLRAELKTTKDGGVVESVSKQTIKELLKKQGIEIEKDQIHLEHNLKDAGEHLVRLSLGRGEEAGLKIKVAHK